MTSRNPLEVELLASAYRRRVTVADHEAFLAGPRKRDEPDEIDEAAADPIHDRMPSRRGKHATKGVLRILDQLDREARP